MAILNNLIVRGATRCLNTLYANSLQVDSQTISGNLTVNGYTYMGYSTSRSDTKLSVAGITNNQWYRSTGSVGWYNDSYGGGIYMTEPTYVKTYNDKAFYAHNGLYTGASAQYYLNSNGKLNAVDGVFSNNLNVGYSIVARNVSVTNTLRAAKYDLQTVTQMGTNGTLYVAPSIQFPTSNTTSVAAASTSITIIDTNITSDVMAGVVWRPSARVKISGTINGVVTGTVDGTITSINTSSKTMVIGNLSGGNWSSVVAGTYTKDKIENLNIMMYETYQNSTYYPVGILLTSYGAVSEHTDGTAKTYIDIYGGSVTKPVVRLGNMTGLDAINGVTPSGWGLYTSNGYFSGLIVSSSGKIGGWSLSTNSLTTGTWGSSGSAMLCTGSTTQKAIGGSPASTSGWVFTAGANFGVTSSGALYANSAHISGEITATSGTIGGASITGGTLLIKDANISGKISANHIDVSSITIGSLSGADNYALKDDVPTTVAELTDSGSYLTTSAASSKYATQTNLNSEINARKAVYGTSSTDAGTATKAVTCSNFALYTGASVTVTFSKTNTSSAPQLNVNSTGAKPIKSYTGANLIEGEYKWAAGASITFTYDGTNWRMQDGGALQAKIDAASSASTASSQAGVATQQATNATNAKTAAESAKTAAESAKTAAQSAKTAAETAKGAAETASSQASSAKDTAVSAKNAAVSAKTDAETAKGQAQTAASNASQSATNAANSATAAAEVMGGFTILWNYSAFGTLNNGRGYLCAFDPTTGTKSDANGWVKWNGTKRTITKQLINPSAISPYNIPVYVVCRLSSATATTGTNYMVWYNSGWKSATLSNPSTINNSWTWADNTDIILGKFVETASNAALTEYEIYNPPYTSKQITTNVVTAQSASASAANAAKTATTYITDIDSNKGIKIKPVNTSGNDYLQINSSAINFYRNNVETLKIEDSAIRVGKIGENKQNVYITDGAVQIRDNEDVLAKFSADGVIVGKTDGSNVEINNNSMTMSVAENPIIQLRINDEIMPIDKSAGAYLLDINNAGTATVVIDNSKYNDFSNCSSIKCTVWKGKDGRYITGSGSEFTFGTSKTNSYTFSEVSCKVSYDGEYTFRVTNCVNSSTEYPQTFLTIRYIIEKNTASVILGATDQTEYYPYTVTEGYNCRATSKYSHAEGYETQASSDNSYAWASHAEGWGTTANGIAAHAEGWGGETKNSRVTIASGKGSHAEGCQTKATAYAAHAEGAGTEARGDSSHAEGVGTQAWGDSSHAEGYITDARGDYSHAEGYLTDASGDYSHAGGESTCADRKSQMVIGTWNIRDTSTGSSGSDKGKYSFIIGNGTDIHSRSNAFTVDWNGNVQMYLDTVNVELDNSILTAIQSLGWEDDVID